MKDSNGRKIIPKSTRFFLTKMFSLSIFIMLGLLSIIASRPPRPPVLGPRPGTIELVDICLKRQKPTDESSSVYENRIKNIAEKVVEKLTDGNKAWNFIGLTEAYFENRDPAGHAPYLRREPIPCTKLSSSVLTPVCFDAHLRNTTQPPDITYQWGDVAYIANHQKLLVEGSERKEKLESFDVLGMGELTGWGEAQEYHVIGARFRLLNKEGQPTEFVIPIYVVHLPTGESSYQNRKSQLKNMIAAIKNWWEDKDKGKNVLTPILMGDFNLNHTYNIDDALEVYNAIIRKLNSGMILNNEELSALKDATEILFKYELSKILRADFVEGGMVLGGNYIEGIWIGKEKTFPDNKGTMVFEEYEPWDEFCDFPKCQEQYRHVPPQLTDHRAVYAKLYPLTWAFKKTYNTTPRIARSNDGPALFGKEGTLYLAWSGRESGNSIIIMRSSGGDPSDFSAKRKIYRPNQSDPIVSEYSPSLTRFKQKHYIAWVPEGKHIHIMSTGTSPLSEHSWSNHKKFNYESDKAPAIAASNDYIFIAWKEKGGEKINFMKSTDGMNWGLKSFIGVRTDGAPTMAYYQDKLFIAWIGTDERHVFVMSSSDNGYSWTEKLKILNAKSDAGPALLAVHKEERILEKLRKEPQDRLYLMWRGKEKKFLQIMSSPNGEDWSHAKRVLDETSDYKPALAYFEDRFVIAWTGRDNEKHINLKGSLIGGEISIDVDR